MLDKLIAHQTHLMQISARVDFHFYHPAFDLFYIAMGEHIFRQKLLPGIDYLCALLKPHLADGGMSATLAASLMDTSLRTLQRRLSASGTTYRTVVDELRFNEAKKLLENTSARVIDIAAAVGFDDPAHFARMFRRVGGLSPREFRNSMC